MENYRELDTKTQKSSTNSKNKILMTIGALFVLGCFIPFQKDTKFEYFDDGLYESYEFSNIEFIKTSSYVTQLCPETASNCHEVQGFTIDTLIFTDSGEWVSRGDEKAGYILYVSDTKHLYTNAESAKKDETKYAIDPPIFKDSLSTVSGHSRVTTDCYIYGLLCLDDDYSHHHTHETVTFDNNAKVKAYDSICEKTYSDDGYIFFECSPNGYTMKSIKSILK